MIEQEVSSAEGTMIAILKELNKSSEPLGSITITRRLKNEGILLSARGVRYHLKIADARGYTHPFGHKGRMITIEGRQEIKEAMAERQLGFAINKLEMLAYQTTFNPEKRSGQLPVNVSIIDKDKFKRALSVMKNVFEAGLCVSDLVAVAMEGDKLGSVIIPSGKIGFATISGVVVNGVLLKAGVPTEYRYGGVLEVKNSKPERFIAIIDYDGTSLSPSEQFIRSKMTSVREASKTGNGKVLGIFCTIPAPAREVAEKNIAALKNAGIGGVYAIGDISEPLCQISVALNRIGIVQLGGLNPVAGAVETGIEVDNIAESGLIDFQQLQPFGQLHVEKI